MPVPSTIADLSTVAADNSPQGSEPIGTSLDNYIRAGYAFIKQIYNLFPVSLANGGTGSTTAAGARTNLGLGSAATLNAGTAANNVVQLTADAKLPAVDASFLTGVVVPDASITPAKQSQPFTAGTAVTASGTSVDFTGVPSWAKRITVTAVGLSGSGTSRIILQLGTSGGVETTGYAGTFFDSSNALAVPSNGMPFGGSSASTVVSTTMVLTKLTPNTWEISGVVAATNAAGLSTVGGSKSLSGVLDRVRITTVGGTETFDAGSINIMWE